MSVVYGSLLKGPLSRHQPCGAEVLSWDYGIVIISVNLSPVALSTLKLVCGDFKGGAVTLRNNHKVGSLGLLFSTLTTSKWNNQTRVTALENG